MRHVERRVHAIRRCGPDRRHIGVQRAHDSGADRCGASRSAARDDRRSARRISDSYDVLRVPLNLADRRFGEAGTGPAPRGEEAPSAEIAMRPDSTDPNPPSQSLVVPPAGRRGTSRAPDPDSTTGSRTKPNRSSPALDDRGTPAVPDDDSARQGKPTQPTRHDDRGRSGSGTQGKADTSKPAHTARHRSDTFRPAAVQHNRTSAGHERRSGRRWQAAGPRREPQRTSP